MTKFKDKAESFTDRLLTWLVSLNAPWTTALAWGGLLALFLLGVWVGAS